MAAPYIEVESRDEEFQGWFHPEDYAHTTISLEGINQSRSFIRSLCIRNDGYWNMGSQDWRTLVAHFYGIPPVHAQIVGIGQHQEILIAAAMEGVGLNKAGFLRLRLIGGVKARKAIKRGDFQAPKLDMEAADEGWSEAVRNWSRSRN